MEQKKTIIIHQIETLKNEKLEEIHEKIMKENSAIPICSICKHICIIPVRSIWFSCNHISDNGRTPCIVYMCLDCALQFFGMYINYFYRPKFSCPNCGIHKYLAPTISNEVYVIDETLMKIIDIYFQTYSHNEALIRCIICGKCFHTVRDLFNHRTGKSGKIISCNSCHKW